MKYLAIAIKSFLIATAFSPIPVFSLVSFPYIWSKALTFHALVEIALMLSFVLLFLKGIRGEVTYEKILSFKRNPLAIALAAFLVSAVISTIAAENVFHAWWGNAERGDGLLNLLHYAAFAAMTIFVFNDRDWRVFFRAAIVAGAITAFYAWLQYMFVSAFPFALSPSLQPGSFFENPAFLGEYLLLLLAPAAVVFVTSARQWLWQYAALLTALLVAPLLFITNVRGVILGLFGGVIIFLALLVAESASRRARNAGVIALAGAVIVAGAFWFTREAPLWGKIPGVSRIANISADDFSVKTRLIALGVSWEAFKEKPLFGWGLENYNVAYNAHYNPEYAAYEEAWFDRAHNKVAEVAVMQGLAGLIAYLGIFIAAFFLLIRKRRLIDGGASIIVPHSGSSGEVIEPRLRLSSLLIAAVAAYFIQNLFLFDTPMSYLILFSLFGFIMYKTQSLESPREKSIPRLVPVAVSGLGMFLTIYSLYAYTYLPYRQSAAFWRVVVTRIGKDIVAVSEDFLRPYTYVQPTIRSQFLKRVNESDTLLDRELDPLSNLAIEAMEEVARREPNYDPRTFINLAEAYTTKGRNVPELLSKAEARLVHARTLAPKRQDPLYLLAFAYARQNRFAEAVGLAREAVALNPRVAKAHYHLGVELFLSGKESWDEAIRELTRAREIGFLDPASQKADVNNIIVIYQDILSQSIRSRNKARVVSIAQELKAWSDLYDKDMDAIINLVEQGKWETLLKTADAQQLREYATQLVEYAARKNRREVLRVAGEMKKIAAEERLKEDLEIIIGLADGDDWELLAEFLGIHPSAEDAPAATVE